MNKESNLPFPNVSPKGDSPRIAIIGCGAITESYYLPALEKQPSVIDSLILVDQNLDRAKVLATKLNVKQCLSDYREIFNKVDGVIVALPTNLHYPISLEFLSRGIPVLCEKPLAESSDRAKEMVNTAAQNKAALAANYLQRFIPTFAKVKEWLDKGQFGKLRSIQYIVGEEFDWPSVSGFYFNSPLSARGILRDRGAHAMDHICWWLGDKPILTSSQNDSFGGSEAVAELQFEYRQCIGEVKLSWLGTFPSRFKLKFDDDAVIIEGDVYDYQNLFIKNGTAEKKRFYIKSDLKTKVDVAIKVVNNFIGVITHQEEPLVSGRDVLNSIEFIDECYAKVTRFQMPWYADREVLHG